MDFDEVAESIRAAFVPDGEIAQSFRRLQRDIEAAVPVLAEVVTQAGIDVGLIWSGDSLRERWGHLDLDKGALRAALLRREFDQDAVAFVLKYGPACGVTIHPDEAWRYAGNTDWHEAVRFDELIRGNVDG